MALACQRNSYLTEFKTKVKSCTSKETTLVRNGKKEKVKGYEVVLEDTILFPEGGGQPDDRGLINEVDVLRITRRGADAVNFVTEEIPEDTEVQLRVDWKRRFDHMQQHTGQHLITVIAENMYGCPTTSWNLGEKISSIELDIAKLTDDQVTQLEDAVNDKIRQCIQVTPRLYQDKNDPELQQFRCRGLPDDHEGAVRVLCIEGIDSTLCCGTHVSNLAHLQLIKLLWVEKAKKKDRVNLMFVAGGRVLQYLGRSVQVERSLNTILKGPLEDQAELAEKAIKGYKNTQKSVQNLLRDLAVLEAQKYINQEKKDELLVLHRKEGDIEFMNILVREINDVSVKSFLTVGDDKAAGMFLLSGPEEFVTSMGPRVAELLEGKGSVIRGSYQGKVSKLGNKGKAEKLLREYIKNQSSAS